VFDDPDDLVSGSDGRPARSEVAFGEMKIGTAHAARQDPNQDLARRRNGNRTLDENQWMLVDRSRLVDNPGAHD
jgi:hypothetical protein